jgi:iron(II)-dependent oxidoreductase
MLTSNRYNPWDLGTARRADTDETVLAQLTATIGADFANGDTMGTMPESFWDASIAAGRPLALQPEGGGSIDSLAWDKAGWGYWPNDFGQIPVVDELKVVEHRHITMICNRWNVNHTVDLQQAFFNGNGFVSWEVSWPVGGRALHRR